MAKTATGLPYPLPTDPIAQGADAIKGLAEAIDKHIQSGSVVLTGDGTNQKVQAITFPTPFVAAPIITTGISNWNYAVQAASITATGCTFSIGRRDAATFTAAITVSWIAVGTIA